MPIFWFFLKMVAFIFFFILLRGALPRYRYHKLMDLGWKVLIPVALVWTMVTAAFVLLNQEQAVSPQLRLIFGGAAALIVVALLAFGPREAGVGETETSSHPPELDTDPDPTDADHEEVTR
jgi:NADH-quinone oxidoreductase subunit H